MRIQYGKISPEEEEMRRREGSRTPNMQLAMANAPDVAFHQVAMLRATN